MAIELESTVRATAERYAQAWNDRDLDAIMALHGEHTAFHFHGGKAPPHDGHEAVREAFAAALAQWAELHFATRRLLCGADFFVHEAAVTATLAEPLDREDGPSAEPGATVRFDAVDVVTVQDGLVAQKDTYIDALAVQAQVAG